MIDKIYHALLWFCGFQEGEHISDMLARQKARLGIWWWFFPISTVIILLAIMVWLIIHIVNHKLKGGKL